MVVICHFAFWTFCQGVTDSDFRGLFKTNLPPSAFPESKLFAIFVFYSLYRSHYCLSQQKTELDKFSFCSNKIKIFASFAQRVEYGIDCIIIQTKPKL